MMKNDSFGRKFRKSKIRSAPWRATCPLINDRIRVSTSDSSSTDITDFSPSHPFHFGTHFQPQPISQPKCYLQRKRTRREHLSTLSKIENMATTAQDKRPSVVADAPERSQPAPLITAAMQQKLNSDKVGSASYLLIQKNL